MQARPYTMHALLSLFYYHTQKHTAPPRSPEATLSSKTPEGGEILIFCMMIQLEWRWHVILQVVVTGS